MAALSAQAPRARAATSNAAVWKRSMTMRHTAQLCARVLLHRELEWADDWRLPLLWKGIREQVAAGSWRARGCTALGGFDDDAGFDM